jgi:1-hydroxycarotenoid 3,4-desaturase
MTVKGRVVVVGAGMGGLAASVALSARGFHVTTLDAADGPGGKMREVGRASCRERVLDHV